MVSDGASSGSAAAEVGVENNTEQRAYVSVVAEGDGDEILFDHTFVLEPGTFASREAVDQAPTTVVAFTKRGLAATWPYDPQLGVEFDCEIKDIGLTLHTDRIEPWYDC